MVTRRSYIRSLTAVFGGVTIAGCSSKPDPTKYADPLGKVQYVGTGNPLLVTATEAFIADGIAINGQWVKPDLETAEHFVVVHTWAKNEKSGAYFPKPSSFKILYGDNVSERTNLGRFFTDGDFHITYSTNWVAKAGGDGVNYPGVVVQGWEAFPVKESYTVKDAVFELTVPDPPDDGGEWSWKFSEEQDTTITPKTG